jgi:hypothetical protein
VIAGAHGATLNRNWVTGNLGNSYTTGNRLTVNKIGRLSFSQLCNYVLWLIYQNEVTRLQHFTTNFIQFTFLYYVATRLDYFTIS